jgi:hypothetical protein
MALTLWVASRNTHDDGRGKTYRSCRKHESLWLHDLLSTGHHLSEVCFIRSWTSNLPTAITTYNITENNCTTSHAQTTTALHTNVFLTRIHRLLVTNREVSAFPSANDCQGQLHTAQLVSVLWSTRTWTRSPSYILQLWHCQKEMSLP